tara:strand:+ start:611 stop:739 length:129 start_codon:yes stop_codon:yes gene_type:complete
MIIITSTLMSSYSLPQTYYFDPAEIAEEVPQEKKIGQNREQR